MRSPDRTLISPDKNIFNLRRALTRLGFPVASPRRWRQMYTNLETYTPAQHTQAMSNDLITAARDALIAGGVLLAPIPEPMSKLLAAGFLVKTVGELFVAGLNTIFSDIPASSRRDRPPQI